MNASVMWEALAWPGLEHLAIRTTEVAIEADGLVVALDQRPIRLRYRLRCDLDWTTRLLTIEEEESGTSMTFQSDGAGRWTDENDRVIEDLAGCIDVDIAATPFTNTLPIRRLGMKAGDRWDLRMVYVMVPELTFRAADQRYTCLAADAEGATFRYESGSFQADLTVDPDGLVVEYPELWRRRWPIRRSGFGE
jgi:uncharacterized protein